MQDDWASRSSATAAEQTVMDLLDRGLSPEVVGPPQSGRSRLAANVADRWAGRRGEVTLVFRDEWSMRVGAALYPGLYAGGHVSVIVASSRNSGAFPARRADDLVIFDDVDEYRPNLHNIRNVLWLRSLLAWPGQTQRQAALQADPRVLLTETRCTPLVSVLLQAAFPGPSFTSIRPDDNSSSSIRLHEAKDLHQACSVGRKLMRGHRRKASASSAPVMWVQNQNALNERPEVFSRIATAPTGADSNGAVVLMVDANDEASLMRAMALSTGDLDLVVVEGVRNRIIDAARALCPAA